MSEQLRITASEMTEWAQSYAQNAIRAREELNRTSDSLLKMDIRAAHAWRRLKAACL